MERRKFESLQAGRGIAALMVLLAHIGGFIGGEAGLWQQTVLGSWLTLGGRGVDFFFVLSGIVILSAHWDDLDHPSRIGIFLWKRFRRIYPIYWLFLIPTVMKQMVVDDGYVATQRNPFVILSGFLLVHIRSLGVNLLPSWTLFHEVLFYMLFSVLLLNRRLGLLLGTAWFATSLLFLSVHAFYVEPSSYLEMLFSPLHLLFGFGMIGSWMLYNGYAPTHGGVLLAGLALFLAGFVTKGALHLDPPWVRLVADAGMALAVITAAEREHLGKFRVPHILSFFGDASYSIYLSHFMVISVISRAGFRYDQRWHLPIGIWMLIMFVSAVLFGVLVHLYIERPLLGLLGRRRGSDARAPSGSTQEPAVAGLG